MISLCLIKNKEDQSKEGYNGAYYANRVRSGRIEAITVRNNQANNDVYHKCSNVNDTAYEHNLSNINVIVLAL